MWYIKKVIFNTFDFKKNNFHLGEGWNEPPLLIKSCTQKILQYITLLPFLIKEKKYFPKMKMKVIFGLPTIENPRIDITHDIW